MTCEALTIRLAWLAGIVDGEGSIGMYISTKLDKVSGKRVRKQLIGFANITNCDARLIKEASTILTAYGVKHRLQYMKPRGNRKACWYIQINSLKAVLSFLDVVTPFLVSKKERAELVQAMIRHRRSTMDKRETFGPRISAWEDEWLMRQLASLQDTNRQKPRHELTKFGV